MKKILVAFVAILLIAGVKANAVDMVIDAKNQSFSEAENKSCHQFAFGRLQS